jgi:hypothetical protein
MGSRGHHTGAPSRQARRNRRRVRTTATRKPERLRLARPKPCGSSGQRSRSWLTCTAFAPHPVARRKSGRPVKGRRLTRGYPDVTARKDAPHQLLQPTPEPSTLWTVRFPAAPSRDLAAFRGVLTHAPTCGAGIPGGASLDGVAPASAWRRLSVASAQNRSSAARLDEDPAQSWWSFDRSSSVRSLPAKALSAVHRARSVASDVLCRSHRGGRPKGQTPSTLPGSGRSSLRQKRRVLRRQDAFPRRVLPPLPAPPCLACARRRRRGENLHQPAPVPDVSTGNRLAASFHHPKDGWPDPGGFLASLRLDAKVHPDRMLLVDFCNQYSPRAQPCDRSIPGEHVRSGASSLRWTGRRPPEGVDAFHHLDRPHRVAPWLVRRARPCGGATAPLPDASRGFTG